MKIIYVHNKLTKIIIFAVSVIIVILLFMISFSLLNENAKSVYKSEILSRTVIIDAGHGGVDGGAVAADGTVEKDLNLSVSKKTDKLFRLFGYNTVMTRTEDTLINDENCDTIRQKKVSDIKNRANILEKYENAVLLSIHQNKFSQSKYSGSQVFYSGNNEQSIEIAQNLQDSIRNLIQKDNKRQIKKSGSEIYLLYTAKKPAVMIECGFLSNDEELSKLKDDKYRSMMSFAVFLGLNDYYTETFKPEPA